MKQVSLQRGKPFSLWIAVLGIFHLLGALSPAAQSLPATPAQIRIKPAAGVFAVNDVVQVEVRAEEIADLYGADIRLIFDPSRFQVLDANPSLPGVQVQPLDDLLSPDFIVRRNADNQTGTIWYAATQLAPRPSARGSGALFSFQIKITQSGTGLLQISEQSLATRDAELIPASVSHVRLWAWPGRTPPKEFNLPLVLARD